MPEFPTYQGQIPSSLQLLNPRHLILFFYWFYFRPTALRRYLFDANSELYRAGAEVRLFGVLRDASYRNLYLVSIGVSAFLSLLLGLPIVLILGFFAVPANSTSWLEILSQINWFEIAFQFLKGSVFGVLSGLVFGWSLVAVRGVSVLSYGVVRSAAFSIAFGVAFGVTFGGEAFEISALAMIEPWWIGLVLGFALANGSVLGLASGTTLFLFAGTVLMLRGSLIPDTGLQWLSLALILFSLRIPFYLLQLCFLLFRSIWNIKHPLEWDELIILPLPGTQHFLTQRLKQDQDDGVQLLSDIVANSFQRRVVQKTLNTYLRRHEDPLGFLYSLIDNPALDSYVFAPLTEQDWEQLPTTRSVLLGLISGQWVDGAAMPIGRVAEKAIGYFTNFRGDRQPIPATRFAGMLYELLDKNKVQDRDFELPAYREIYTAVAPYAGGKEIEKSFELIALFLACDRLDMLSSIADIDVTFLENPNSIRPKVLEALKRLQREVVIEAQRYSSATNSLNRLGAIARSNQALNQLDIYLDDVSPPEQTLLKRIVSQWQPMFDEAGAEIGQAPPPPIENPYIAGNPVQGSLFVGREDLLNDLINLWRTCEKCPSIVLYGHRRMGKTSILKNIEAHLESDTHIIIDFNMQRVGLVDSTSEFLYSFALSFYDRLPVELQSQLGEPKWEEFRDRPHYLVFDRFLQSLDRLQSGQQFLVAADEFEAIELLIEDGKLDPRLLEYFRGLIQTYPWIAFIFAGLHTLEEMVKDYWEPFFGSVTLMPVSFLSQGATKRLLEEPDPNFCLDFGADAIDEIYRLTHGQPYLVQLIGWALVRNFNRQICEQGIERDRRLTLADVEAVIHHEPKFYRDGEAYFSGVWGQAANSKIEGQTTILEVLCESDTGLSFAEIVEQTNFTRDRVTEALATLERHDVVVQRDGKYVYTVELMSRWVARRVEQQGLATP